MKNIVKLTTAFASVAMLAGCSSTDTTVTPPVKTFATVSADASAMQDLYTDATGRLLATTTKATSAEVRAAPNATYTGFVSGDVAGSQMVGELTIDADFGAGTTDSTATGFFHETDGEYTGTLTGTGTITPNPPGGISQVSGTVSGDLTNGGTIYVTAIGLEGDLVASGGDPVAAIAGIADGTVGGILLTGAFAAEK